MKSITYISFLFLLHTFCVSSARIATLDYLVDLTFTDKVYWNNFIGLTLNFEQVRNITNQASFLQYFHNSNLQNSWSNNFFATLRIPQKWNYNCEFTAPPNITVIVNGSSNGTNGTNDSYIIQEPNPNCEQDLALDQNYLSSICDFAYESQPQAWGLGFTFDNIDWYDQSFLGAMADYFIDIIMGSQTLFVAEMGYQMDKYIEKGLRRSNYTRQDWNKQFWQYEQILFGYVVYKVPGLSEDADEDWLLSLNTFSQFLWYGVFTFEPVIFDHTPSISQLLSSTNTKGYIQRRQKVNNDVNISFTGSAWVSFTNVRLTNSPGANSITNSFAAGLWWIQFVVQCAIAGLYDVSIDGTMQTSYYQSMWQVNGNSYKPTVFYYASIFVTLAGVLSPQIVIPDIKGGESSSIKAWGFESYYITKFLILNKDQTRNLTGNILIQTRSSSAVKMSCLYFKAQDLNSTSGFTVGGFEYLDNESNGTLEGSFEQFLFEYNPTLKGFEVQLKYAQAVLCEIPNPDMVIPTKNVFESWALLRGLGVAVIIALVNL